jgi:hypothetical protein
VDDTVTATLCSTSTSTSHGTWFKFLTGPNSPPPPREQLCNRSCSNKTHTVPYRTELSRPPAGCVLGSVVNPFDRVSLSLTHTQVWTPTTSGHNLSSLALTPGEPTPYVCMYVSMVCGVYVGMCWVRGVNASLSIGRNSKLEG